MADQRSYYLKELAQCWNYINMTPSRASRATMFSLRRGRRDALQGDIDAAFGLRGESRLCRSRDLFKCRLRLVTLTAQPPLTHPATSRFIV